MAVLRVSGPNFLAERFMAESPLTHCARIGSLPIHEGEDWPAVSISVSLAPWREWQTRLEDLQRFLAVGRGELIRLRERWQATSLVVDFPLHRPLSGGPQGHRFPSALLRELGELGIELTITYLPPDFTGAGERHPRIVIHPQICGGKPVIHGTRVLVRNLVDALAAGETLWQIQEDFPDITAEDVAAAVAFLVEQSEHA